MAVTMVVLAIFHVEARGAAPPPLDRPTPPACCADGICYPNPTTFGVYATRWRRWPTERLEPTPAGVKPPAEAPPELPSYERPRAEEEERAAPPPTKAAEEAREEKEKEPTPQAMPPGPGAVPFGTPPGPGSEPPLPFDETPPAAPTTPPGMRFPWETEEPTTPSTTPPATPPTTPVVPPTVPLNSSPPTGDWDPPPPPPFGAPSRAEGVQVRAAERSATPRVERPAPPRRQTPSNDPPPAFPIALADAR
jgi:hypothetical protein